jgi:hypothetical protein
MLKVKLYFFSSFFLVEVVRFFVTYGLARNKTGSVKDGTKIDYKKTPENNFFSKKENIYISNELMHIIALILILEI